MSLKTTKQQRKYGKGYELRSERLTKKDKIISIRNLIEERKMDLAKENIDDYISTYSEDCYIIHECGRFYSKIGEINKAQEYFLKNIDDNSENICYSLYELGKIYISSGELEKAMECYTTIINSKHKEKEHALLEIATIYFMQCRYDESENVLLDIINNNYKNKDKAIYDLVQLKISTKDIEIAEYYITFLNKNDDYYKYQLLKGQIELYKGNIDEGKKILNEIIRNSNEYNIKASLYLSECEYNLENYEESLEYINYIEGEESYSQKYEIIITKINIYFKLKKIEEALLEIEKLLESNSYFKNNAYFYLGKIEIYNQNFDKAQEYFEKVEKYRINLYYMAQLQLIYVFIKQGLFKDAYKKLELYKDHIDNDKIFIEAIELYLTKKLNIINNIKIDSYLKELIVRYNKENVLKHIESHKKEDNNKKYHTIFYDNIDLHKLYEFAIKNISKDNFEKNDFIDSYIIDYPNIGYIGDKNINQIKVITLPNSKEIVTIYPYDKYRNYSYEQIETKEKTYKKYKKRESQIDKFNRKFNIS